MKRSILISQADGSEQAVQAMPLINYAHVLYGLGRLDEAADYAERGYAKAQQAAGRRAILVYLLVTWTVSSLFYFLIIKSAAPIPRTEPTNSWMMAYPELIGFSSLSDSPVCEKFGEPHFT